MNSEQNAGWIALPRNLEAHPIFSRLGPAVFKLAVWMIWQARWRDGEWYNGQETIALKRGTFITSLTRMADATGLSIKAVRCACEHLKGARVAACATARVGAQRWTLVTILDYDTYQPTESAEGHGEGHAVGHADGKVQGHDVNRRRVNKEKTNNPEMVPAMEIPTSDSQWTAFAALYPPNRLDTENAERAFLSRSADATAIMEGLRLSLTSEQWTKDGGRFVPRASRWIADGAYRDAARLAQTGAASPSQENTCHPDTWARIVAGRNATAASPYFDVKKITGPVRVKPTPEEAEKQRLWYAEMDAKFAASRKVVAPLREARQ